MRTLAFALVASAACLACDATTTPPTPATSGAAIPSDQLELTQRRARIIRTAATDWRAEHAAGMCPTVADLKAARNLDPLADDLDAWGREFIIRCSPADTRISSRGPDATQGTLDDVAVDPAPAPMSKAAPPPDPAYTPPPSDTPTTVTATAAAANTVLRTQIDPRVHDCYVKALGREPKPEERVEGTITIAPNGSVKKMSLSSATFKDVAVKCVADVIETAKFEPSPDGTDRTVKYP